MENKLKGNLALILVSAIWGLTFPLIRNAVDHIDPFLFVFSRFLIATFVLMPFVLSTLKNTTSKLLMSCLLLGFLNAGGYVTQTIGLVTINATRSAFITGFYVVLVPFFAKLLGSGDVKRSDLVSSGICILGIYILTGANLGHLVIGDLWTFLSAVLFAIAIAYLQRLAFKFPEHRLLAFYQILFTIPFAGFFSYPFSFSSLLLPHVLTAILFCGIVATSVAFYLQAKYQKLTTVVQAALIYALEPVFACIFDFFINGEAITFHMLLGGGLILLSLALEPLLSMAKAMTTRQGKKENL